jgi:hypothetical protein
MTGIDLAARAVDLTRKRFAVKGSSGHSTDGMRSKSAGVSPPLRPDLELGSDSSLCAYRSHCPQRAGLAAREGEFAGMVYPRLDAATRGTSTGLGDRPQLAEPFSGRTPLPQPFRRARPRRKRSRRRSASARSGARQTWRKTSLSAQVSAISGSPWNSAEPASLAFCEPLAGLEQAVAGAVEVSSRTSSMSAVARAVRPAPPGRGLALVPDRVERGVGAAHQVEVVDDDPRPWAAHCGSPGGSAS